MITTDQRKRSERSGRRQVASAMGQPGADIVLGVFAYHPSRMTEIMTMPSVVFVGQTSTTQNTDDGSFPFMADVDGLDEAGLG